jgi:hypothetical protein
MKKEIIINNLIKQYNYKKYLEIGVKTKYCFNLIQCESKISVDPSQICTYDFNMTSDEFFAQNKEKFDIIFIDGLHLAEQVDKDIVNSLNCLNQNGSIVLHDTNPPTEFHACESYPSKSPASPAWNGTVWKSIFKLRKTREDLEIFTYNCDWGVTVVRRGKSTLLNLENEYYSFDIFNKHRNEILNIIECS